MNIWVSMVTQLRRLWGCRPWDGPAQAACSRTIMWFVTCSAGTASYSRSPHEKSCLLWGRYLRATHCFHAGECECARPLAKKSTAVSWRTRPMLSSINRNRGLTFSYWWTIRLHHCCFWQLVYQTRRSYSITFLTHTCSSRKVWNNKMDFFFLELLSPLLKWCRCSSILHPMHKKYIYGIKRIHPIFCDML